MTLYTYTDNVPNGPNNPSVDQPKMKVNTKSIKDLIGEDHVTFGINNGGFHNKSRYIDTVGFPTGLIPDIGTVYTKKATSTGATTESDLFYIPDTGDPLPGPIYRDYQLTRTITGSYPLFAKLTQNYNGFGNNFFGGWTFLPGGMLFQYGTTNTIADGTNIDFPVPFTNVAFSLNITLQTNANTGITVYCKALSATNFKVGIRSGGNPANAPILWTAIGV